MTTMKIFSSSTLSYPSNMDNSTEMGINDKIKKSIEELDISYNKIGQNGTRSFLSVLNPDRIRSLNFAAVGKYAVREVAMFLSQCIPHNLVHLNLAYCDIDNADMEPLLESLKLCPQLQKLNLAGNKNLSKSTLHHLLQMPLIELNLAGIKSNQPLITSIENLYISSNMSWGDTGPFSFCSNNLSNIIS